MKANNNVSLIGNLGQDPELRNVGSTMVCTFSLAVNETYTKDGERHTKTNWIPCDVWGKQAEVFDKYVKKGHKVAVIGSLRMDTWEQDGQNRTKIKVVVSDFKFLQQRENDHRQATQQHKAANPPQQGVSTPPAEDDDLPF